MRRARVWTLIDTRVWVLALRAPLYPAGSGLAELAGRAAALVTTALTAEVVLFTPQLVGEIHHVTTARVRPRMESALVARYLRQVLGRRNVRFRDGGRPRTLAALERSAASGIHVWDYLVVLPWERAIDRIVTMDPHYRHPHFTTLARVENPLGLWRTEGEPLA
jgi:hypothetical protein